MRKYQRETEFKIPNRPKKITLQSWNFEPKIH